MAIDDIEAKILTTRNAATAARAAFTDAKTRIASDDMLSDEGKRETLSAARQDANAQITELQNRELAIIAEAQRMVERKLAGTIGTTPDAVIAFRDAQDRADSITDPREATRILERALLTGDSSLANAVAQRALSAGWRDVAARYTKDHPEIAGALEDRAALNRFTQDMSYIFARGAIYSAVV